jgi:dihydrodipicolinate synthase/N-acetylneuraminate lyase
MKTTLNHADLAASVIAVPPLCRDSHYRLAKEENLRLVRHLEDGGVRIFLYGGNANLYNIAPSEYPALLDLLEEIAGPESVMIPSVGPYYGTLLDQAAAFVGRKFPTAMVLPASAVFKPAGVATSVRHFVEKSGIPAVVYIKNDGYLDVSDVAALVADGCVSWIKYAVVRPDERQDPYLRDLCQKVDPAMIVSGMGEQPTWAHLQEFGLGGFTSGCVCVAPQLSTRMLGALKIGNRTDAEAICGKFFPLEDLRNNHGPIPVLHHAVQAAGIARTGPMYPLLTDLPADLQQTIAEAAVALKS